jgi:multicomponent Na+:H+ antiporter subunit D
MGAVLYRTGTAKGSELGGLYKSMPWTTGFCIVGAASISGFPLLSGFVTKSMILTSVAQEGYLIPFLVLLFASAGVFHHSGIKIPFFAFFAHDSGKRPKEAPFNMLLAMGITSALCIGIGVYPQQLYLMLPFPVDYVPYTTTHVVTMLQLLFFSGLAFAVLQRTGLYPQELKSTVLDFDWVYRKLLPAIANNFIHIFAPLDKFLRRMAQGWLAEFITSVRNQTGPGGVLSQTEHAGNMVQWVVVLLSVYLVLNFL